MKITADDWHFIDPVSDGSVVAVDLFLDNGQHARLEVFPLVNPYCRGEQVPEIRVFCELPGEKLHGSQPLPQRWLTRAPDCSCPWTHVEISGTLVNQLNDRLSTVIPQ